MSSSALLQTTLLAATGLLGPAMATETMYVISPAIQPNLLSLDPATGTVLGSLPVSGSQVLTGGLSARPSSKKLYTIDGYNDALQDRTFRIDSENGQGDIIGYTGYNWNFRCVEFDPTDGTLYAARDNELFTISLGTGVATPVTAISGTNLNQVTALAIDAAGNAYVTDTVGVGLFTLDMSSGNLTHLGDLNTPSFFRDLAFDEAGTLWGIDAVGSGVYTIDIAQVTATLKFTGPSSGYWGIAFMQGTTTQLGTSYCFGDPGSGNPCPCGNENDGSVPGSGCRNGVSASGARLEASGTASVGSDSVVLHTSGLQPGVVGLYFQGDSSINGGDGVPFGDGLRCVGGAVIRLQLRSADSNGESETNIAIGFRGGVAPGDEKHYQCWYRSTLNSPCGSQHNLSNAYRITWTP